MEYKDWTKNKTIIKKNTELIINQLPFDSIKTHYLFNSIFNRNKSNNKYKRQDFYNGLAYQESKTFYDLPYEYKELFLVYKMKKQKYLFYFFIKMFNQNNLRLSTFYQVLFFMSIVILQIILILGIIFITNIILHNFFGKINPTIIYISVFLIPQLFSMYIWNVINIHNEKK